MLLGGEDSLLVPRNLLYETETEEVKDEKKFQIVEISLASGSDWAGKTLAELDLRRQYGMTVLGIQRGKERIFSPPPGKALQPNDRHLVLGHPDSIRECQERGA